MLSHTQLLAQVHFEVVVREVKKVLVLATQPHTKMCLQALQTWIEYTKLGHLQYGPCLARWKMINGKMMGVADDSTGDFVVLPQPWGDFWRSAPHISPIICHVAKAMHLFLRVIGVRPA